MKKFFEAAPNTLVDAYSVTAIQGRTLGAAQEDVGNITIFTHGGNVLVPSQSVTVDLARLREQVETLAVPQVFAPPVTVEPVTTSTPVVLDQQPTNAE